METLNKLCLLSIICAIGGGWKAVSGVEGREEVAVLALPVLGNRSISHSCPWHLREKELGEGSRGYILSPRCPPRCWMTPLSSSTRPPQGTAVSAQPLWAVTTRSSTSSGRLRGACSFPAPGRARALFEEITLETRLGVWGSALRPGAEGGARPAVDEPEVWEARAELRRQFQPCRG